MLFFLVFNTLSLQNFKRGGIHCRVLSSVSFFFLVYNDVLFFLVFDYISFCFLAVITVVGDKKS